MCRFIMLEYVLCFFLVVLAYIYSRRRRKSGLEHFPRPAGYMFVGNAFQIDSAHPHHTMSTWARQLGPFFVFTAFGKEHLVISSPEALYECLVVKGDEFGGRPSWYRADFAFEGGKSIAFQTLTPRWRALRKCVHKSVKQYGAGIKRLEDVSLASIEDFLQRIDDRKGEAFDIRNELYETFTHIVCQLVSCPLSPFATDEFKSPLLM